MINISAQSARQAVKAHYHALIYEAKENELLSGWERTVEDEIQAASELGEQEVKLYTVPNSIIQCVVWGLRAQGFRVEECDSGALIVRW